MTALVVLAAVGLFYTVIAVYVFSMALVARCCGVKSRCVGVGFGPPIFRRATSLGDVYVGIIPLGGYTTFVGEDEAGTIPADSFKTAPKWVRAIILLSGPVVSAAFGVALLALPAAISAPQLAVGGAGGPIPNSAIGPLTSEAETTTWAGQWELARRTAGELLTRLFGFRSLEGYGGWVGAFYTAGRAAVETWPALLTLVGIAAVANGVCNLLPVPVLNGGHLVLLAVEAVAGRRATERVATPLLFLGQVVVGLVFARLLIADLQWWAAVR